MKIENKLKLHRLAIKLIDAIAYERSINEIRSIIDELAVASIKESAEASNTKLDLEKELINQ